MLRKERVNIAKYETMLKNYKGQLVLVVASKPTYIKGNQISLERDCRGSGNIQECWEEYTKLKDDRIIGRMIGNPKVSKLNENNAFVEHLLCTFVHNIPSIVL